MLFIVSSGFLLIWRVLNIKLCFGVYTKRHQMQQNILKYSEASALQMLKGILQNYSELLGACFTIALFILTMVYKQTICSRLLPTQLLTKSNVIMTHLLLLTASILLQKEGVCKHYHMVLEMSIVRQSFFKN